MGGGSGSASACETKGWERQGAGGLWLVLIAMLICAITLG